MDDRTDDLRSPKAARIEIFAGAGRQRWDDAVKARIVAESLAPGAIVTHVARRHGCRPQQVHDWRRLARQGLLVLPGGAPHSAAASAPLFVPLLAETPPEPALKRHKACADIVVEIDGAVVHVRGRPEGEVLNDIFSALRRTRAC
jgi:transposase